MALGRRKLLLIGGGVVCAHAIGCGGMETIVLGKEIPAGLSTDVALNTLTPVPGKHVAVGRDANGIYALTLVCTHQGCDIAGGSVSFAQLRCPCHGSEFNNQGQVLLGPAPSPLAHLQVTKDANGQLTIHGDTAVAISERVPV
jgi:cytochrome b6-f complex iron-sulfur subunit